MGEDDSMFRIRYETVSPLLNQVYDYMAALASFPDTVTDAIVTIHQASIRTKSVPESYVYHLAFDSKYSYIAKLAIPRMLSVFPTRCNKDQLMALKILLWCAVLRCTITQKNYRWSFKADSTENTY